MLGPSVTICGDCVDLARGLLEAPRGDAPAPPKPRECPFCERTLAEMAHEACKDGLLASLLETSRRRREELFDVYLPPDFDERIERSLAAEAPVQDETSASTYADLARAFAELGMGQDALAAVVCSLRLNDPYGTAYATAVGALSVVLERRGLDVRQRLEALVRGG